MYDAPTRLEETDNLAELQIDFVIWWKVFSKSITMWIINW
jgi:hypothetical protein